MVATVLGVTRKMYVEMNGTNNSAESMLESLIRSCPLHFVQPF
jgi:hypothetical protein